MACSKEGDDLEEFWIKCFGILTKAKQFKTRLKDPQKHLISASSKL